MNFTLNRGLPKRDTAIGPFASSSPLAKEKNFVVTVSLIVQVNTFRQQEQAGSPLLSLSSANSDGRAIGPSSLLQPASS
jgi:hypothetical protein